MKAATIQFQARMATARTWAEVQETTNWWIDNVCPTCTNTGMDEGKFCEDCVHGKSLSRQATGKT